MSDVNKALARRYPMEVFEGNTAIIDEIIADEFRDHDPQTPSDTPPGPDGARLISDAYRTALHDMRFTIHEQIAEGDRVLTRWTLNANHRGELMGAAPTGNPIEFSGLTLLRISNGKIAEEWSNWDGIGLLKQLGQVPGDL